MAKYMEEDVQEIVERTNTSPEISIPNQELGKASTHTNEFKFDINKIPEFKFDVGVASTFKRWFERHQAMLESELGPLRSAEARAQFVTAKLGIEDYNQFSRKIMPKRITDLKYVNLIDELNFFFDPPTALFRRRLKQFETTIRTSSYRDLWGRIKA